MATAVAGDKTTLPLTSVCPECGLSTDLLDLDHVVVQVGAGTAAVVIGCEGYWVIDPKLVGIVRDRRHVENDRCFESPCLGRL